MKQWLVFICLFSLLFGCNNSENKINSTEKLKINKDSLKGLLSQLKFNDTILLLSNNKKAEADENSFGYDERFLIYYSDSNSILIKQKSKNSLDSFFITDKIADAFYNLDSALDTEQFICTDCEQTILFFNTKFVSQSNSPNNNKEGYIKQLANFYSFKKSLK